MEYPWYETTSDSSVLQGEFFEQCPVFKPPLGLNAEELRSLKSPTPVPTDSFDAVVISQSCDIEARKIRSVLLCPHDSWEEFAKSEPGTRPETLWNSLTKGYYVGVHLLQKCEIAGFERGYRVVDFRLVFTLPLEYVESLASHGAPRLRLCPPYREHLAQAFARFLMRVGLPVGIPSFGKR